MVVPFSNNNQVDMRIISIIYRFSCSFLYQFLHFINHEFLFKVWFFLYTASVCAAQQTSAPPTMTNPFYSQPKFNPSLAIIMIIVVSAFFVMGFFSVFVRRCAEGRYRGRNFNPNSVNLIGGGGRWSRRVQQGLDTAVIETFPTFLYSTVKGHKIGKHSLECAVCLNEFEDDQTLRLIPKCNHIFHPDCIDAWLSSHTTCPVCRANLVPKPGDSLSYSTPLVDPNNNSVEPPGQLFNMICDETPNGDVLIHVPNDNNNQNREVSEPQLESQNVILLKSANQNRSPRCWSTGWRLDRLFPRSHSIGHSLVQPGENLDRFTLRLPEEVRNQLLNTHLNRTKSCVTFTRLMSSRTGYRRSRSSTSYLSYERFDREGQPDRWAFNMIPPFVARTSSVRNSKGDESNNEVSATPPKNLLKSVKNPIDRLFIDGDNSGSTSNVGERSSDRLTGG